MVAFDTNDLLENNICPSEEEFEELLVWLEAWVKILTDPSNLSGDLETLKNVRTLIYGSKQNLVLMNDLPLEFSESIREIANKKSKIIQIIYSNEMRKIFHKISLMEQSDDP